MREPRCVRRLHMNRVQGRMADRHSAILDDRIRVLLEDARLRHPGAAGRDFGYRLKQSGNTARRHNLGATRRMSTGIYVQTAPRVARSIRI